MCLLVSACLTFTSIPNNLQKLPVYILLLVYRDNDEKVTVVVLKYFMDHASRWLSPENVCLSIITRSLRFPLMP